MPIRASVLPADLRLTLHQETMQLRAERKWGYRRISRALSETHGIDVPEGTVQNWTLGTHDPSRRLHRYFEATPSPELSYTVGIVLGDGYVTEDRGRGIVALTNKDIGLLRNFLSCISRILNVESAGRITRGTLHGTLKATVASRLLALFLRKPLPELAPIVEKHADAFIRGFFDAEGSSLITVSRGKLQVGVKASNSDIRLLEYVSTLLRKFGITGFISVERKPQRVTLHGREVVFKKTVFRLQIRRLRDLQTYAREIGFGSERKQRILEDALASINDRGSASAAKNWLRVYSKIGHRWFRKTNSTSRVAGGPGEI